MDYNTMGRRALPTEERDTQTENHKGTICGGIAHVLCLFVVTFCPTSIILRHILVILPLFLAIRCNF